MGATEKWWSKQRLEILPIHSDMDGHSGGLLVQYTLDGVWDDLLVATSIWTVTWLVFSFALYRRPFIVQDKAFCCDVSLQLPLYQGLLFCNGWLECWLVLAMTISKVVAMASRKRIFGIVMVNWEYCRINSYN